jgi:hypothetical protein
MAAKHKWAVYKKSGKEVFGIILITSDECMSEGTTLNCTVCYLMGINRILYFTF